MDRDEREQLHRAMVRLADGDRSAFDPVYAAVWPVLRRFAARAMRSEADAEDAAQAALIKVFSRASEFDATRDARSWILGIVAYECRTLRQKARRRREELGGIEELGPLARTDEGTPEERVIAQDLQEAALEALGTLGAEDVDTLRRVLADERPEGATFRKRVERAMRRLREAWRVKHGTE
ncbi:RNA polymerase sigma factor [Polyangium mundeleinium]|uniref:Sigma factor n=1 Tax=Polyangium mundeleinium TaxID=2995306 RepID=A0ABT5EUF8_9BACT|nr:sigma factor [Polyangium mundeleinium]MDC0745453.1 sigma factor [Polyangium mundeleinium]